MGGRCVVEPLPPRAVPLALWRYSVTEFNVYDGLTNQSLEWGTRSTVQLRPDAEWIQLDYEAPNGIFMRRPASRCPMLRDSSSGIAPDSCRFSGRRLTSCRLTPSFLNVEPALRTHSGLLYGW